MPDHDEWTTKWILRFHNRSGNILTLCKFDNIKHAHSYKLGNKVLDHIFSEKDLGLILDSNLSFEQHYIQPSNKSKFNGQFKFELKGTFAKVQINSFFCRSIKHWSKHPWEVVNSPSIVVFKKRSDIANKKFL